MFMSQRQSRIIELAKSSGRIFVEGLAEHFDVTPQTIRKDLNELCDSGCSSASMAARCSRPASKTWNTRRAARSRPTRRRRSARRRRALIPDNASLFINIGTTTEAVSKALLDHTAACW